MDILPKFQHEKTNLNVSEHIPSHLVVPHATSWTNVKNALRLSDFISPLIGWDIETWIPGSFGERPFHEMAA